MATKTLSYATDGGMNWRHLPWRRILCGVLVLYFGLYGALRVSGQITHRWGELPGKSLHPGIVGHNWAINFERGQELFMPAMALEMALRDLGPTGS